MFTKMERSDEADVFLEDRDKTSDVQRNSIVAGKHHVFRNASN